MPRLLRSPLLLPSTRCMLFTLLINDAVLLACLLSHSLTSYVLPSMSPDLVCTTHIYTCEAAATMATMKFYCAWQGLSGKGHFGCQFDTSSSGTSMVIMHRSAKHTVLTTLLRQDAASCRLHVTILGCGVPVQHKTTPGTTVSLYMSHVMGMPAGARRLARLDVHLCV